MSLKETLREEDVAVRRQERTDGVEFVADFGSVENGSVDIVDETALVVVDDSQYDIELEGDAQAFMNNGVLTIEVER